MGGWRPRRRVGERPARTSGAYAERVWPSCAAGVTRATWYNAEVTFTAIRRTAPMPQASSPISPITVAPKVGFVSLGCPKALVDSEQIITQLRAEGYEISGTYDGADLVVVNTCGFIDEAVQESLDAIGEALTENGKVIVTGCLGAKKSASGSGLIEEVHPKVLAVTGPHALGEVMQRGAHASAEAARSVRRSGARCGREAHAAPLRVSEDFRRLQPPLHVLHHPVDARRPRVASGRGSDARSGKPVQVRREGTAGDFAGHERVRRRREIPHRFLERQADQDAHDGPRRRARRTRRAVRRVGAPALRVSVSERRRSHPDDGRRSVQGPRAAVSRRAVPARASRSAQAHEAPGQCREGAGARAGVARDLPGPDDPQHVHRRLPGRDRRAVPDAARLHPRGGTGSRRLFRLLAGRRRDAPTNSTARCPTKCAKNAARASWKWPKKCRRSVSRARSARR